VKTVVSGLFKHHISFAIRQNVYALVFLNQKLHRLFSHSTQLVAPLPALIFSTVVFACLISILNEMDLAQANLLISL